MGNAKGFVSAGCGAQYLLPLQQPGDLTGVLPGGAQIKDMAHHGGGLLVHYQLLAVLLVLNVPPGGKMLKLRTGGCGDAGRGVYEGRDRISGRRTGTIEIFLGAREASRPANL